MVNRFMHLFQVMISISWIFFFHSLYLEPQLECACD